MLHVAARRAESGDVRKQRASPRMERARGKNEERPRQREDGKEEKSLVHDGVSLAESKR